MTFSESTDSYRHIYFDKIKLFLRKNSFTWHWSGLGMKLINAFLKGYECRIYHLKSQKHTDVQGKINNCCTCFKDILLQTISNDDLSVIEIR